MTLPLWAVAILLGIVEGLTEFLPISSTGHLIVASELVGFTGRRAEVFQIFIQIGAILSVVWEYRVKLTRITLDLPRSARARAFGFRLALAFLPAALLGLAVHDFLLEVLFSPLTVALALIGGAVLIFYVEALPPKLQTHDMESMTTVQALGVGLAQCVALWPGFSRSAATIMGGVLLGLDRRAAVEFSFFLAIPTMLAATVYNLYRSWGVLEQGDLLWMALALVISFLVAWGSIKWLLHFVSTHDFRIFAWYRLALGIVILIVLRG